MIHICAWSRLCISSFPGLHGKTARLKSLRHPGHKNPNWHLRLIHVNCSELHPKHRWFFLLETLKHAAYYVRKESFINAQIVVWEFNILLESWIIGVGRHPRECPDPMPHLTNEEVKGKCHDLCFHTSSGFGKMKTNWLGDDVDEERFIRPFC